MMRRLCITAALLSLASVSLAFGGVKRNPYREPLKARAFSTHAFAPQLPPDASPKMLGEAIREGQRVMVEVRVMIEDYLPRALEPVLVIDGVRASRTYRIIETTDRTTTLGFLVDKPEVLREGASFAVQMGEDEGTRSKLKETFTFNKVGRLTKGEARTMGLPVPREPN